MVGPADRRQRIGAHASLAVDRHSHDARAAEPEHSQAFNRLGCASSPAITVIGGAPNSPSASTFQPARASTACRAAASAVKFATVRAGHEGAGSAGRQIEQLDQPAQRDLLEARDAGVALAKAAF